MRTYPDPKDEFDQEELKRLKAEQWMLDLLKLNPSYTFWGPYEDYMCNTKGGWGAPAFVEGWDNLEFSLDELNECCNFYFQVSRESEKCTACDQTGYNPATRQISEDWYDFEHTGRRWQNNITQHEVDALVEANRLMDFTHTFTPGKGWKPKDPPVTPTAAEVNEWSTKGMGHDSINHHICTKARAQREGVWGKCEKCEGHGHVYTKPAAQVNLVLWWMHPRKGATRAVEVQGVKQCDLPKVFAFLREAAERNADRFSKIPGAEPNEDIVKMTAEM